MKYKATLLTTIIIYLCSVNGEAQSKSWGERMAETILKTYPDSIVVKKAGEVVAARPTSWDYEQGVILKSFNRLWERTHDQKYLDYSKKIMDQFIQQDGTIRTYDLVEYNSDNVTPGIIVLWLYKNTREEKYKKAAYRLREQLTWQPRTKEGGFWHKMRYPYQMWLDGLYMYGPFYAEFASTFNEPKSFDDVANQFIWVDKHTRDSKTGLMYHGWDESKQQAWANPVTGCSPHFWGRALGWYAMGLVDVLEFIPKDHPKRKELVAIFQHLAGALKNYQDQSTGAWYQIVDRGGDKGNYIEASASCMFTYAIAKGVRLGYIDKSFSAVAKKGFDGLVKNFIETDKDGFVHLTKIVSVAGLGGTPYRSGSYEYYLSEPLRTDDLKGVGPFISASVELELIK